MWHDNPAGATMNFTVDELMTRGAHAVAPDDCLDQAARRMDDLNIGVLPVCQDGALLGIVTDRDLVVRGIAQDKSPRRTPVREVMSTHVRVCFEDQRIDEVLPEMRRAQIRRMPVLDRRHRLVGMLSLADIATRGSALAAAQLLAAISEPAAPDRPALTPAQRRAA